MGMTAQDCPREEEGLWMELRGDMDYEFDPVSVDEHGTQLYEIVVKTTEEIGPILEQTPGINRSGDLCALHPTRKNTVNLRGRRGDLVSHSSAFATQFASGADAHLPAWRAGHSVQRRKRRHAARRARSDVAPMDLARHGVRPRSSASRRADSAARSTCGQVGRRGL